MHGYNAENTDTTPVEGSAPTRGDGFLPTTTRSQIDLDRLLKLRLVVARFGEMDLAKWWNTKGQLGRLGLAALRRGFPRTHYFAQGRSVFAVAAQRCSEVFEPPECVTLWRLPESVEEEFDARWEHWLDNAAEWTPFFQKLENLQGSDLTAALRQFGLARDRDVEGFAKLRRSAEGRAVPLLNFFCETDDDVALLALGFAKGEVGSLAVPYARKRGA
ncbi:MAG: BrxE family protein [Bryobacteraceae bacterium]